MNLTKVVILAGGYGSRLGKLTKLKPKPMVDVCGKPILEHIINIYKKYDFNNFVICTGYKSEVIRSFFKNKYKKSILRDTKKELKIKNKDISITVVYTGKDTLTGGRIKKIQKYVKDSKFFHMTYGDGLSNIKIKNLIKYHYKNKASVTLTAVRPKQRYGVLKLKNKKVNYFDNSKKKSDIYINGGFFVISQNAIKKIKSYKIYWEKEPITYYLKKKELFAFRHEGFWKSLDTLKDKNDFDEMIRKNKTPWKNIKN